MASVNCGCENASEKYIAAAHATKSRPAKLIPKPLLATRNGAHVRLPQWHLAIVGGG